MNATRCDDFDVIIIDEEYSIEIHDLNIVDDQSKEINQYLTRRFGV